MPACRRELASAEAVLEVARVGIDHWDRHVQASLDWEAGKISEDRKKAIWKATRLAGPADLREYDAAVSDYERVQGRCADLSGADAADCVEEYEATAEDLRAAAGAMGDWRWHQEQMAMFAEGAMSARHANMMWNRAKRIAPRNLEWFASAERTLAGTPRCS